MYAIDRVRCVRRVVFRGSTILNAQQQFLPLVLKDPLADRALVPQLLELPNQRELIQAATEELTKGRTSVLVAHRLSTIRDADRILCLDAGEIVEQGSHDELLAAKGAYHRLFELQFDD